jgi:hypothetical protein
MAIKYPFGSATVVALTATGAQAVSVTGGLTVIDGVTVEATGARTINLTIDSEVKEGAMILVKSKTNATENTVFGTNMTSPTIAGTGGKTKTQTFFYDGTSAFIASGAFVQID